MLMNPVSNCMISLGVVVGVLRILFMILSNIVCMCFISFLVGVHVSVAYISVGIRHVSMSFHIIFISILLKLLFPAILKIVWIVASALPFNLLMWSSFVPLLFIVVPNYLYVVTSLGPFVLVWMVFLVFFLLLLFGFFLGRIWYGIILLFHPLCLASFGVHLCFMN